MIMNTVNMFRFVLGSRARGRPFNLVPPSALHGQLVLSGCHCTLLCDVVDRSMQIGDDVGPGQLVLGACEPSAATISRGMAWVKLGRLELTCTIPHHYPILLCASSL